MNCKMFRSITLVNLSFLTILFFTFISCQLEQPSLADPQSDDPFKEGSYSAYIINDPALKEHWNRHKIMVYKPLDRYISFNFNIGDFNDRYLIKVRQNLGDFDPALSSIYLDDQEFPIKKIVEQGSSYIGFKDMSFQDWVNIKTNKLLLKLKLGFQGDASLKNTTISYAYLYKSSYGELFNWRDLQNMKEKLDGNYRLMRDISFPEPGTEGFPTNGFEPVGSDANPFTGSLDGNSKTISGLYIDRPNQNGVGLFGFVDDANTVIRDLQIVYQQVKGYDQVGALVGRLVHGRVKNIRVQGYASNSLVSGGYSVGGMVGRNQGVIDGGISEGNVSGHLHVGGMVGVNYSTVTGYATGSISGSGYIGGLMGVNNGTLNGYATGSVSGSGRYIGGLVGLNRNNGTVTGYATGSVTGSGNDVGGLVGYNWYGTVTGYATGSVTSSGIYLGGLVGGNEYGTVTGYWDIAGSGQTSSAGGLGISSINNVVYYEPNRAYRDTATENDVFYNSIFTQYFDLPERNAKWPILKESVIGEGFNQGQKALMGWTDRELVGWTNRELMGWTNRELMGWTNRELMGWTNRELMGRTNRELMGRTNRELMGRTNRELMGWTNRELMGRTNRELVGWTNRELVGWTNRELVGWTNRELVGWTNRELVGWTNRELVGWTNRELVGWTNRELVGRTNL